MLCLVVENRMEWTKLIRNNKDWREDLKKEWMRGQICYDENCKENRYDKEWSVPS